MSATIRNTKVQSGGRGPRCGKAQVRHCKYEAEGQVSFRLCPRGGRCEKCAFAQMVEDLS